MARRKRGRDIDGVVLLDKPIGGSSNAVLQRVRRAFDALKAGHTGSLDPLASGLLPICLGEATKVSSYLLHADKHYRVTADVGARTATGDREGEVIERSDAAMPERAELERILEGFVGAQQQIPPMYSALKHEGKPLYEHARAGRTIERAPRDIVVYAIRLMDLDADRFTLDVRVSGGTYIRTLVEDIAARWGGCAHVSALRRVAIGGLSEAREMTSLAEIEQRAENGESLDDLLWPVSSVIEHMPTAQLSERDLDVLAHGGAVTWPASLDAAAETVRLGGADGSLLGLGRMDSQGRLAPRRLFARMQR